MKRIILDTNMYYYIVSDSNKQQIFEKYLKKNNYIHEANAVSIMELINAAETDNDPIKKHTAKKALDYISKNCSPTLTISLKDIVYINLLEYFQKEKPKEIETSYFMGDLRSYLSDEEPLRSEVIANAKKIINSADNFVLCLKQAATNTTQEINKQNKKYTQVITDPEFKEYVIESFLTGFFGINKELVLDLKTSCNLFHFPVINILYYYYAELLLDYVNKTKLISNDREDMLLSIYWMNVDKILTADTGIERKMTRAILKANLDNKLVLVEKSFNILK